MTTLFLVRHGETVDNVNRIMQGQTQGELTENGIRQVQMLADKWKNRHVDVFLSSDLKRSVDTCRLLAAPHGAEVRTTELLRERDWGSFTGQHIPDIDFSEPWPEDIESLEDLRRRAARFLDFVRRSFPGLRVVAVGHGIINKAIQAEYHGKAMRDVPRMGNADVRVLQLE